MLPPGAAPLDRELPGVARVFPAVPPAPGREWLPLLCDTLRLPFSLRAEGGRRRGAEFDPGRGVGVFGRPFAPGRGVGVLRVGDRPAGLPLLGPPCGLNVPSSA